MADRKKPSERIQELIIALVRPDGVSSAISAIIAYLDEQAAPPTKFCPSCQAEGKRSRIDCLGGKQYALGIRQYYDEDGVFHSGQPRGHCDYRCSNGHAWREEYGR